MTSEVSIKEEYFNGMYDIVFKDVLCTEKNKDILKILLEKVMNIKIDEISFGNKELKRNAVKGKGMIVDAIVKSSGRIINIEINNGQSTMYRRRNFIYACNIYGNSVDQKQSYSDVIQFAQLNLSRNALNKTQIISKYLMKEEKSNIIWDENLIIYEVNMEKIEKLYYNKDKESINKYKELMMLVLGREELEELSKGDEIVKRFKNDVDALNSDRDKRFQLIAEKDQLLYENTMRIEAKKIEDGKKELDEGKKELDEGKKELASKEKELVIREEKITSKLKESAKALKDAGVNAKEIQKTTGLTIEEINKL